MTITIVGSGAFGTALALCYAACGDVILWSRNAETLAKTRHSPRLPGHSLPDNVVVTDNLACLHEATVLLALPTQQLGAFLEGMPAPIAPKAMVACCKGIDLASGLGPVDLIARHQPSCIPAVLTGPSFAVDIAKGLPTALIVAAPNAADADHLQDMLAAPNLRVYSSDDVMGAQLGGALKNVIAIACGAVMGAGLGVSARAALLARGLAEMRRFSEHFGAQADTLSGLAGLGDLVLTATSEQSRNYRFGVSLAVGRAFDASTTVEGAATARAVVDLARSHAIDVPICETVASLVAEELTVQQAMERLLARPLKREA
ncbi:MAG: NAD(P)-dependent glycerol-3-phosphate dehydrogenase [Rhodobacteraceae bacterium]|nr:NAD(P)-dependent glycerol-3-phosphate dehydrogenase [Paracoccaceae bacterium]